LFDGVSRQKTSNADADIANAMTQSIDSLHKILKDQTRRKAIKLIHDRGSLSYTELMENLDIASTGTLNYHLKVLGDLLEKDAMGQYKLSGKGELAFKLLTEFPNGETKTLDKRTYMIWAVLFSAVAFTTILNGIFGLVSLQRTGLILAIVSLSFAFAFYIRIKPSQSGNRAFFIAIGAICLGFVLWFIVTSIVLFSGLRWQIVDATGNVGDDFVVFATLILCWIVGGFVGEWIGKRRNYVIPTLRL
jgi:hypothetical protein